MENSILDQQALDQLFLTARSFNGWQSRDVSEEQIRAIYDLAKMGPTSANCSPMRIILVRSEPEKERLATMLDKANQKKSLTAPYVAILAHTRKFYEDLPRLFPHADAKSWFIGNDAKIEETMWRNGTLQCAYFMMAVRAMGLDCGPVSGFNKAKVKEAFFPDFDGDVNFICNIGYGDPASIFPRLPRLEFEEVCKIV